MYTLVADLVLLLHGAFVLFALFGGLLLLRWPRLLWWHVPALVWGIMVQWANWICPLTPLENHFRLLAGHAAYEAGFVEHYVSKILYPENLTLELRYLLGLALAAINAAVYLLVIRHRRGRRA
ncbi:DUF2784 domain-containing protein [Noviherbaspirillum massiliense]|uniref:DUF2784 domain-containing protein n=1 Tax=Noviherbaspirillum massiliense TaxID=1465823 RepID=UPI000360EB41